MSHARNPVINANNVIAALGWKRRGWLCPRLVDSSLKSVGLRMCRLPSGLWPMGQRRAGLIFIALLAGNLQLTGPVSGAETAYKELITHSWPHRHPGQFPSPELRY